MAKTVTPGTVELEHGSFEANAMPDVFDARDLEYRPRLQPLGNALECRPKDRHVMVQSGNSCTGHAVAAMANAALAARGDTAHVSPYMAYALARRYDDYQGDADEGSSLRGALKGWFYHGLLTDSDWPSLDASPAPDIDHDEDLAARARQRPLGAFYRVNATRLDDLQSAVSELSAVAAAAAIHDGWTKPVPVTRTVNGKKQSMHVITKTRTSKALGGHAFCIVGYNEVGFLVQNSWGPEWGHKGFATLPYDDWLESGYDAWVARPGVPAIISQRAGREVSTLAGGGLALAPAADINKLAPHVVNVGNNGRLSTSGRFTSSPAQLDQIFTKMRASHEEWEAEASRGGCRDPSPDRVLRPWRAERRDRWPRHRAAPAQLVAREQGLPGHVRVADRGDRDPGRPAHRSVRFPAAQGRLVVQPLRTGRPDGREDSEEAAPLGVGRDEGERVRRLRRPPPQLPRQAPQQAAGCLADGHQAEGAPCAGAQASDRGAPRGAQCRFDLPRRPDRTARCGEDPDRVVDLPRRRSPHGHLGRAGAATSPERRHPQVHDVRARSGPRARRRHRRQERSRSTTSHCSTSCRGRSSRRARRPRSRSSAWPTAPRPRSRAPRSRAP